MRANFHESYAGGEVKPPSERSTGLLFAVIALIFAGLWRHSPIVLSAALCAVVVLAAISLLAPTVLTPINILWFRFGLLLHRIVNPMVMLALFVLVFVPAGAVMRTRRDPLRVKRVKPGPSTYWIQRGEKSYTEGSMTNQF
jgi:hypothetical protein